MLILQIKELLELKVE
ncbi:hypothetical protein N7532_007603 [Penicillium argentinense]|uniref:Uncharacterized protein n=1 Tax=Penicillium argentinense TaxID=1131581 RepID=A0A9W9K7C4_9EURO|nr:hypothetical protein N7532_007603 [Penicillium argentinense]